jgi:hypothetical protein
MTWTIWSLKKICPLPVAYKNQRFKVYELER